MPAPTSAVLTRAEPTPPPAPVRAARWGSLDALKGIALFGMVAHHLASWTGGHVRERWIGFDGFVVTDLAAPMFAVALGAGAYLVGTRLALRGRPLADLWAVARRWAIVWFVGVAVDIANGSGVDGGGVLYTLAVLGLGLTVAVAYGGRSAWLWWGTALVAAGVAGPILGDVPTAPGLLPRLWSGQFPLLTYLVFAAVGAALAAHGGGRGEGSLPLVRAAGGVVVAGAALATAVPATARDGIWPPSRYPGDLAFTVWGVAASLVLWALLRAGLRNRPALTAALGRAGRRTLWVFGLHFGLRVALAETERLRHLTTYRWGLASWAAVAVICGLAAMEWPAGVRRRRSPVT